MQTCQRLVQIEPCNSHALYLLGNVQLSQYDDDPEGSEASQALEDAKRSFMASIGQEGKPKIGDPPAELLGMPLT